VARSWRSNAEIHIEGEIAYVPLTKGKTAVIDAADVPLVREWAWHAIKGRHGRYYAQRSGQIACKKYIVAMHRVIAGALPGEDVDHEDSDTLNNRRKNLRRCTRRQNMGNTPARPQNKLGVKGVCASATPGKFIAHITREGRTFHLGTFSTVEEASAAYAAAAKRVFGEFARTA